MHFKQSFKIFKNKYMSIFISQLHVNNFKFPGLTLLQATVINQKSFDKNSFFYVTLLFLRKKQAINFNLL